MSQTSITTSRRAQRELRMRRHDAFLRLAEQWEPTLGKLMTLKGEALRTVFRAHLKELTTEQVQMLSDWLSESSLADLLDVLARALPPSLLQGLLAAAEEDTDMTPDELTAWRKSMPGAPRSGKSFSYMSRAEAAAYLNVAPNTYRNWEEGRTKRIPTWVVRQVRR